MPVNYNFKKGIDLPNWQWLAFFQAGVSYHGTSNIYDGRRYLYWAVQYGTTSVVAGTSQLWRFDTWTGGWQYLATTASGGYGMDIEYDPVRNVLLILIGAGTTSWQVFNLNLVAVTVANVVCAPFALTTIATALPAAASYGASFTLPNDLEVGGVIDNGVVAAGTTASSLVTTDATANYGGGLVGLQIRFTSGTLGGQTRTISAVPARGTLTLASALGAVPATGDTFVIEVPGGTATGGTTTTLTRTGAAWAANMYANSDVVITGGTGAGQRRRIASNTVDTLTLAAAVTGNPRTGAFATAPDATSTFSIVPSSDFLYYQPGQTSAALHRIDLVQTTGVAWSAALASAPGTPGGGANTMFPSLYAPFQILCARGAGTSNIYSYNIGLGTWSTLATFWGSETINTGASVCLIPGKRKMFVSKEGSPRTYVHDLLTGVLEPGPLVPYASPGAYDGKRARHVMTPDGARFLYLLRAGGQEFFRAPVEWLD
ncbi:hypothetical protein DAERI_060085 [Deinococcus aerius]|uniref:Uncharacterized protein n=1 Tax=Deinococcus aerius TaxID=200253 RepID=A0A2I9DY98_9DEIO|nr:hypothetical protein [Deinococcus aerius]GBF05825.1 hypothetical protein DAERI_060085 [Deinococcus aerius]